MPRQSIAAAAALILCVACDQSRLVDPPPPVNQTPVADAGGGHATFEGYPTTFDASGSQDPDGDPLRFEWTFEPGSPPQYGITTQHAFTTEGDYQATLVVTDARGAADTATAHVSVHNAPPEITAFSVPAAPVRLDSAAHALVTFMDRGSGDTLSAEIDWGDSVTEKVSSGAVASHRYAAVGRYYARLIVRDHQGAKAEGGTDILVYDPVVDQTNPAGYDVIDLGTLGGSGAIPKALNDRGQVVGCSQTAEGVWHAFVWSDGVMSDLGTGCAWAINNSGMIGGVDEKSNHDEAVIAWDSSGQRMNLGRIEEWIGFVGVTENGAIVAGGIDQGHSFNSAIWRDGVRSNIPSPAISSGYAAARAVNDRGQVVGYAAVAGYVGDHIEHAFLWEDGQTRDLGLLADILCPDEPPRSCNDAFAVAINNNGTIAGVSRDSAGESHAVIWEHGSVEPIGSWRPVAMNDAGAVIGNGGRLSWWDELSANGEAYFWHQGVTIRLDSFDGNPTQLVAINSSSMVTGFSEGRGKNPRVVVWSPGMPQLLSLGIGPAGLNQLGAVATAINARGDVIGRTVGACSYGFTGMCRAWEGPSRAVLWRRKN